MGESFDREKIVDCMFDPITASILAELEDGEEVPIYNISEVVFQHMLNFFTHYAEDEMDDVNKPLASDKLEENNVSEWYCNYINKMPKEELFELVKGSNQLGIKKLTDLCCAKIACDIRGKTPDEINDYCKTEVEVDDSMEVEAN